MRGAMFMEGCAEDPASPTSASAPSPVAPLPWQPDGGGSGSGLGRGALALGRGPGVVAHTHHLRVLGTQAHLQRVTV